MKIFVLLIKREGNYLSKIRNGQNYLRDRVQKSWGTVSSDQVPVKYISSILCGRMDKLIKTDLKVFYNKDKKIKDMFYFLHNSLKRLVKRSRKHTATASMKKKWDQKFAFRLKMKMK